MDCGLDFIKWYDKTTRKVAEDGKRRKYTKTIGLDRYEKVIAHGLAIGNKYDGLYWIVEQNLKGGVRETLLNKEIREIIKEEYI